LESVLARWTALLWSPLPGGWAQHEEEAGTCEQQQHAAEDRGQQPAAWTLIKTGRTAQHTTPKIRGVSVCGRYSSHRR
jgi:hypothetical protein